MQVEPQTPLPVVYQITDHTDPTRDTYFVRAVVRDSLLGTTLIALNLISKGSGRYATTYQAPVDGTGLGRQIDVTTTVYTDSLYTTKHASYAEVLERWYVKAAPVHYGGANGSSEIDYTRIEKMIAKTVAAVFAAQEKTETPEKVDLNPVLGVLARVENTLNEMALDEDEDEAPEPLDLSPVHAAIQASHDSLAEKVGGITVPETDLTPVLEGLQNLAEAIGDVRDLTDNQKTELTGVITKTIGDLYSKDKSRRDAVRKAMQAIVEDDSTDVPATPQKASKFPQFFPTTP